MRRVAYSLLPMFVAPLDPQTRSIIVSKFGVREALLNKLYSSLSYSQLSNHCHEAHEDMHPAKKQEKGGENSRNILNVAWACTIKMNWRTHQVGNYYDRSSLYGQDSISCCASCCASCRASITRQILKQELSK
jgi:hypothetical protein